MILEWFQENIFSNTLMMVFLIAVIGYLVGSIKIKGLELGTAGILLVALVFWAFRRGDSVPGARTGADLLRDFGRLHCRTQIFP